MSIRFVKMHGLGNDYVYLDACVQRALEQRADDASSSGGDGAGRASPRGWAKLVARLSDRHTGIGGDGVILVCPPRVGGSHVRMRMFNADGSESEMCGNGVRCVAKFAHDRLGVRANPMRVETGRGVLEIAYSTRVGADGSVRLTEATVDMGVPILTPSDIPVCAETGSAGSGAAGGSSSRSSDRAIGLAVESLLSVVERGQELGETLGLDARWSAVSMGNPHAVLWVKQMQALTNADCALELLRELGPRLERHAWFPNRTNLHVCWRESRSRVRVLTWERGSGITQACGTGACAVVVAGVLEGRLERACEVDLLGGRLRVAWPADDRGVLMTGPAADVCEGVWLGED